MARQGPIFCFWHQDTSFKKETAAIRRCEGTTDYRDWPVQGLKDGGSESLNSHTSASTNFKKIDSGAAGWYEYIHIYHY